MSETPTRIEMEAGESQTVVVTVGEDVVYRGNIEAGDRVRIDYETDE